MRMTMLSIILHFNAVLDWQDMRYWGVRPKAGLEVDPPALWE